MRHLRNVIGACLTVALLAACGAGNSGNASSTPMSVTPQIAARQTLTGPEQVLYRFMGGKDGANPIAGLTNVGGTLYGTTLGGGSGCGSSGCGTIFKLSTSGKETVLYRFKGSTDGANPEAGVIEMNGALYGSTANGGGTGCYDGGGCGTVFQMNPSGKGYHVLYRFKGGADGAYPFTGVIAKNGALYGVAYGGGGGSGCGTPNGACGTVYEVSTSGKQHVLYTFGGVADGANPLGLIEVGGAFYGVTTAGGGSGCGGGCGTVYEVSTSGKEHVLYSFSGGTDGADPQSILLNLNGALYGTTYVGGSSGCGGSGCGTVYEVNKSTGAERVLWSFAGSTGGENPSAGLTDVRGSLVGVTTAGGSSSTNAGTVFDVSTRGKFQLLYTFNSDADGKDPQSTLLDLNGTLYGTTYLGGGDGCGGSGCGTVFALTP